MSSSSLIRLGGLSALLGGALLTIAGILSLLAIDFENFSESATTGFYFFVQVLYLLGVILILGGLVGLYASRSEAAGILGLVGFLVAFLGTALVVGAFWTQLFIAPSIAVEAPEFLDSEQVAGPLDLGFTLTFGLVSLGWLLFGVAALVTRIYPRWAAIVLIIGAVIGFLPLPGTEILLAVAIAVLGFILLTGRGLGAERPSRVT